MQTLWIFLAASLTSLAVSANSISCQGEGQYRDVYLSRTTGFSSQSTHFCVGNRDDSSTAERIYLAPMETVGVPEYEEKNVEYFSINYKGKPFLVTRVRWSQTLKVQRLPKEKYSEIIRSRDMSRFAPVEIKFNCDSISTGNYHAPCDLNEASSEVRAIVESRLAPLTDEQLAENLHDFLYQLIRDNKENARVKDLVRSANRFRFPNLAE